MLHTLPPIYYIVFTAVTAIAMVLQMLILLGIWLSVRSAFKKLSQTAEELQVKVTPTVAAVHDLLDDMSPKLKNAAGNLNEATHTLRTQTEQWNAALNSLLERTTKQVNRVDAMTTAAFDTIENLARAIETMVEIPARRISKMVRGVRAGFDVLFGKKPGAPSPDAEAKPQS